LRILLINHYAGSVRHGMEYRPYYLSREWLSMGHRVQIVAASESHVRTVAPAVPKDFVREQVDGVDYVWLRTPAYRGNGVGRALNMAAFCLRLAIHGKRLVREFKPDVVVASSTYPMDIWPAALLARRAGAKLVHEIHDLWPLSPIEMGGMSPRHPFILLCQAAENFACQHADRVVSILPCVHEHLQAHGLDLRKLHIVSNGVLADEWDAPSPALTDNDLARHLADSRARGRLLVGYAGAHGVANALDTLLDTAKLLQNEAFEFVLVGQGTEWDRLVQRVQHEGIANVRLFKAIAKLQMPAFLRQLDIAYVGLQQVPIFRFGIAPNKLMDYMMAGRPVLSAIEGKNDPVGESGGGLSVQAESPAASAAGLRRLAALSCEEREAMGARGASYIREHSTWPVLARRFIEAIS
jgi:glycosyltransferase involved in cell wall biosynthesis